MLESQKKGYYGAVPRSERGITGGGGEKDAHNSIYGIDTRTQIFPVTRAPNKDRKVGGGGERIRRYSRITDADIPVSQRKGYSTLVKKVDTLGVGGLGYRETSSPYGIDTRTINTTTTIVPKNKRQVLGGGEIIW